MDKWNRFVDLVESRSLQRVALKYGITREAMGMCIKSLDREPLFVTANGRADYNSLTWHGRRTYNLLKEKGNGI